MDLTNKLGVRGPQWVELAISGHHPVSVYNYHAPQGGLEFGYLEVGLHFVPDGSAIVARRFIAGLAINMICVPEHA
jgi:hypothetical protein